MRCLLLWGCQFLLLSLACFNSCLWSFWCLEMSQFTTLLVYLERTFIRLVTPTILSLTELWSSVTIFLLLSICLFYVYQNLYSFTWQWFFQNLYSFVLNWFSAKNLLFFHFVVEYESIPRVTTRMFNPDPSFQQPATVQVVPDRASFSPMPLVNLTSTDMGHVFTRPLPTATYYRPRQIFVRPPRPSAPSPQLVPVVASSSSATSAMETSRPSTPAPPSDASSFWWVFSSVIFILSLRMDSIVIDQSPQLGLLLAAWRVFFLKLYNRGSLSEGGYYFLLAILTDKSQEALDTEFNPLVISWLKFTLPKIMRARGTLKLLNLMNPSSPTWRNDYLYRHRCLLYLERRANLLARP